MKIHTLTRIGCTVAMGAVLMATGVSSQAQYGQDVSAPHKAAAQQNKQDKQEQKQDKKDAKEQQKQQHRLSQQEQQARIYQQKQLLAEYNRRIAAQQAIALSNAQQLERQKRLAHYRYQQAYYEQLREQQMQLENDDRYDYDNDPFYYTPPTYQYRRGDGDFETNQYGAEQLRRATNTGYQKGYEAGRADKQDHWRFDYKGSFAYQDANYGFDGRYVRQDDYNYYFREGFQRGYEDGYYQRRNYGTNVNGSDSLLGTVLNTILNLRPLP